METQILLSVVIPAMDESKMLWVTLKAVSAALHRISDRFEILVVDDGSTDDTFEQIRMAHQTDPRIKGVRFSRNFGKEAALLAGLQYAQGQAVITLDADLQHPPELIPDLYRAWREGFPIVHGIKASELPKNWLHLRLSRLFNTLFTHLSGLELTMASDYKLLDRRIVRILVEQLPERDRFLRGLCRWVGFRQTSLPFVVPKRRPGNSRWGYGKLTVYALRAITGFSFVPLALIPLLGGLLWLVAALVGWANPGRLLAESPGTEVTFLSVILLLCSGSILLGLGIMSQYLAGITRELQRRPPFLIAETVGLPEASGEPPITQTRI